MKKIISIAIILVTVLAIMLPALASAGEYGTEMWVNCADGKRLNLREEPNTNSKIIIRIDCGTKVDLIRDLGDGWMFISVGKQTGYVMKKFLVDTKPGKFEITERDDNFVSVKPYLFFCCLKLWALQGSNLRPSGYEPPALPLS